MIEKRFFLLIHLFHLKQNKKIAKTVLVVLISSGEKLGLTQDRAPGHDVDHWKNVARRDLMINEVVGRPQEMKLA